MKKFLAMATLLLTLLALPLTAARNAAAGRAAPLLLKM